MPLVPVPKPTFAQKLKRFFMVDLVKGLGLTLKFNIGALTDKDAVVYEGDLDDASSLVFYLHRTFYLVNQPRNDEMHIPGGKDIAVSEDSVLRHWGDPQSIYLIIKQERVPHWQQLLTDRFHIYHQVATSGAHVVLTNQL